MNIALKKETFVAQRPDKSRQLVDFLRAHYEDLRAGKASHSPEALIASVQKSIDHGADPGKRCETPSAFSPSVKNAFRPDMARESALDIAIKEKDWPLVRLMEAVVSRRQA